MIDSKVHIISSQEVNHKKRKLPSKNKIKIDTSSSILESFFGGPNNLIDFKENHFTHHPVVYKDNDIYEVLSLLYDLDMKTMLENTASEKIHVWLKSHKTKHNSSFSSNDNHNHSHHSDSITNSSREPLESISVDDSSQAIKLYKAGHSLYCRVPNHVEQLIIPKVLNELGLGVLHSQSDRHRRGEIETFYSRVGHITDFHTDFQENITIMLSGKKRWKFRNSSAIAPLRGCTPHFHAMASPDVSEQQLKVNRLGNPTFDPSQAEKIDISKENEVVLEIGDILYHPAGIWHQVECLEDSIAINISLIVTSYADVFISNLYQILLQNPLWRSPVSITQNTNNQLCHDVMFHLMESIPSLLHTLSPYSLFPIPCYTTLPSNSSSSFSSLNKSTETSDNDKNSSGSSINDDGDSDDNDDGNSNSDDEPVISEESMDSMNSTPIVRVSDINIIDYYKQHIEHQLLKNYTLLIPIKSTSKRSYSERLSETIVWDNMISSHFRFNPLATILKEDDLYRIGGWIPEYVGIERKDSISNSITEYTCIVHCGYGNENYESQSRVAIVSPHTTKITNYDTSHNILGQYRSIDMYTVAMTVFMERYKLSAIKYADEIRSMSKPSVLSTSISVMTSTKETKDNDHNSNDHNNNDHNTKGRGIHRTKRNYSESIQNLLQEIKNSLDLYYGDLPLISSSTGISKSNKTLSKKRLRKTDYCRNHYDYNNDEEEDNDSIKNIVLKLLFAMHLAGAIEFQLE